MGDLPRLYTEVEAANYLGITPATLARMRRGREIHHITIASRIYRYTEAHLLDYLKQQTVGPASVDGRDPLAVVRRSRTYSPLSFPQPKQLDKVRAKKPPIFKG
jgi:hypothetical protein